MSRCASTTREAVSPDARPRKCFAAEEGERFAAQSTRSVDVEGFTFLGQRPWQATQLT